MSLGLQLGDYDLANNEWIHHIYCNSNRKFPPGTPGTGCGCGKPKTTYEKFIRLCAETRQRTNET